MIEKFGWLLCSFAVGCIPLGIGLMFYYDNAEWLLLSAIPLIVFSAG